MAVGSGRIVLSPSGTTTATTYAAGGTPHRANLAMLMPTPGSPAKSTIRGTGAKSAARCGTLKPARGSSIDTAAIGRERPNAALSTGTTCGKWNTGSLATSTIHGSFACLRNATTNGSGMMTASNNGTDTPATLNLMERTSPSGSTTTKSGVQNTRCMKCT